VCLLGCWWWLQGFTRGQAQSIGMSRGIWCLGCRCRSDAAAYSSMSCVVCHRGVHSLQGLSTRLSSKGWWGPNRSVFLWGALSMCLCLAWFLRGYVLHSWLQLCTSSCLVHQKAMHLAAGQVRVAWQQGCFRRESHCRASQAHKPLLSIGRSSALVILSQGLSSGMFLCHVGDLIEGSLAAAALLDGS